MKNPITKVCKSLALAGCLVAGLATSSVAVNVDKVHFLIPGGAGGGITGFGASNGECSGSVQYFAGGGGGGRGVDFRNILRGGSLCSPVS